MSAIFTGNSILGAQFFAHCCACLMAVAQAPLAVHKVMHCQNAGRKLWAFPCTLMDCHLPADKGTAVGQVERRLGGGRERQRCSEGEKRYIFLVTEHLCKVVPHRCLQNHWHLFHFASQVWVALKVRAGGHFTWIGVCFLGWHCFQDFFIKIANCSIMCFASTFSSQVLLSIQCFKSALRRWQRCYRVSRCSHNIISNWERSPF